MFVELMPLLAGRTLLITVAKVDDKTLRVNVIPHGKADDNPALSTSLKLESGVNFSVSLQIWPKTGICTQNVCSSRSIFRNAAHAASALQRS